MTVENWMAKQVGSARAFARRFASATRGNVAMIFALSMPILVMITMGGIDINRAVTVRANLQDALDAASLAAARSKATTDAELTSIGTAALQANLAAYPDVTLTSATFTLNSKSVVIANAQAGVKTLVANIVLPPYGKILDDTIPVGAHSEVNRTSKNIEVGLVLDITGSMAGTRISDLKTAAAQLVDIVVQDAQSPFYTKMAIIPYSMGVNMGTYANGARGTPTTGKSITGAAWTTGSSKSISAITRASPGAITSNSHGFSSGDFVWISGVVGMTKLNDTAYKVVKINANSFSLQTPSGSAVNTTSGNGYSSYVSGGIIRKCLVSDCSIVITANSHGLSATNNDTGASVPSTVYISGVGGMTQINNTGFEIGNVTTNTYSIGVNGANYGTYSSGGTSYCGQNGCAYRVFRNYSANTLVSFANSTCVSERLGANSYTDVSPSTSPVGSNYPSVSNNPCPASSATIQPLTSNKTTLKSLISGLTVTGSTAGQIGLAWGWYSVSPNFNGLWPAANAAGVYSQTDTLKAVILMTDGEFNTPYCTGVIAQDAGSGSGSNADKARCNGTNGDPFDQAAALCTAMKAQNIIVYTVGFSITAGSDAAKILSDCATSSDYAFLPATGADLTEDFAAIGRDITRLRISK